MSSKRCWRRERLAEARSSGKRPERSFPGRHCCTFRIDMRWKGCAGTVLAVHCAHLTGTGELKGTDKTATIPKV